MLIQLSDIGKSYHGQRVLQDITLSLAENQTITVIGPNGAGKSTLLKLILGLEVPDNGTIERAPGLRIGYVPQHFDPTPIIPITVEWWLSLSRRHPCDDAHHSFSHILEETGIASLRGRLMHTLSGGERQRVMLARALLCHPKLLLLDEPVQGVDLPGQIELYALIERLSRSWGCSVLMVSHDLHLVMSSTSHVVCLNHHICCEGSPQQVGEDPAFIHLFGREVAGHVALYRHHHDHAHDLHGDIVDNLAHDHAHEVDVDGVVCVYRQRQNND